WPCRQSWVSRDDDSSATLSTMRASTSSARAKVLGEPGLLVRSPERSRLHPVDDRGRALQAAAVPAQDAIRTAFRFRRLPMVCARASCWRRAASASSACAAQPPPAGGGLSQASVLGARGRGRSGSVLAGCVVPDPPLVGRGLGVALGRIFPLLLAPERGYVE